MTSGDPAELYERDLYTWGRRQAAALRRAARERVSTSDAIDWLNVADEIDTMARSQVGEMRSRYRILLLHLLKWQFQPQRRSTSWQGTIVEQRDALDDLLLLSPGLKRLRRARLADAYRAARQAAAIETGLALETFPVDCPFSLEEAADPAFWPSATPSS